MIAVEDDADWQRLVSLLGEPEWATDTRYASTAGRVADREQIEARLAEWTAQHEDYAVMELCQQAGIAAGVVQDTENLLRRDPQLAARGFFETIPHFKRGEVTASGIPLGLTATPGRTTYAGSSIGHDNEYVFREVVGLTPDEIAGFVERGAIEETG